MESFEIFNFHCENDKLHNLREFTGDVLLVKDYKLIGITSDSFDKIYLYCLSRKQNKSFKIRVYKSDNIESIIFLFFEFKTMPNLDLKNIYLYNIVDDYTFDIFKHSTKKGELLQQILLKITMKTRDLFREIVNNDFNTNNKNNNNFNI